MGYVEKQLADDEQVVFQTTLHPVIFLGPSLFFILGLMLFAVEVTAGLLVTMIAMIIMTGAWIKYTSSEFAVTDRRVIIKTGFISRKTIETLLTKVEGIQVDQGILGRMMNFGQITVTGTGGTHEPFKTIKSPLGFRTAVQEGASTSHVQAATQHLQALQAGGPSVPEAPPRDDVVSQLERLGKLRESGVLSQEEFEDQKKKVLGAS